MHRGQHWRDEYGLPLLFFIVWSIIFSWPLPRYFTSHLIGVQGGDTRHNLWVVWHVREAILSGQPFWDLPILYYPTGASLLTHGLGPVTGFLALPFWPWGAEAAHNGAVLVSLILTGYAMYLLARSLELPRAVALFAGLFLLAAPMHLVGLQGHMTKVFIAGPPLALLCFLRALDRTRSLWWAVGTGAMLLVTLAHSGYQFIFTAILLPLVALLAFWQRARAEWRQLVWRLAAVGLASAVLVGPMLLATRSASATDGVRVASSLESLQRQPDAIALFLPSPQVSRFFGAAVRDFLEAYDIESTIETAVYLSWTGLLLAGIAWLRGDKWARGWLLISAVFIALSLGPRLQIMGKSSFTEYQLPLILPYAFLTGLPGLDFMRVPGRFMMVGYVTWGLTASMGLAWLVAQRPQWQRPILLAVTALLLVEFWPMRWPVEELRPVPTFYQELAADKERYGVLDLPVKPAPDTWDVGYSSYYQMYQMTHGKGIATGYISRTYDRHPLFPCLIPELMATPDILINGEPVRCYENALYDLAQFNYRYVVRHKPQPWYEDYTPGSWGEQQAAEIIDFFFGSEEPLFDDELATVYAVPPMVDPSTLKPNVVLKQNWYQPEPKGETTFRWASSPATLSIYSPRPQSAILEVVPDMLYDPELIVGAEGRLALMLDNEPATTLPVRQQEKATFTLQLSVGWQDVHLSLAAGNFRPFDLVGSEDRRELSFSIHSLNLILLEED